MTTRFDKFTIKAQEALQATQDNAGRFGNQQMEPLHLLLGLVEQPENYEWSSAGQYMSGMSGLIDPLSGDPVQESARGQPLLVAGSARLTPESAGGQPLLVAGSARLTPESAGGRRK